jgi:hypothetical protein
MNDLKHHAARAALAATLLAVPAFACGAVLHGLMTGADGAPIAGAIVSLGNADGHSDSAYTDAAGRWHLVTDTLSGRLQLRARAPGYADATRPLTLAAQGRGRDLLAAGHPSHGGLWLRHYRARERRLPRHAGAQLSSKR